MYLNYQILPINLQEGLLIYQEKGITSIIGAYSHHLKAIVIKPNYRDCNLLFPKNWEDYQIHKAITDSVSLQFYDPTTGGESSFYQLLENQK